MSFRALAGALKRQLGIRSNRVEALWFDLKSGTRTRGKTAAAKLGLQSSDLAHLTGYQAVNEKHLRSALEASSFPRQSVFVDIGCGKGKALLIAAGYDFIARAVGVELAPSLCDDARRNVERLRKGGVLHKPVDIVEADAARYRFMNGENIFFVNNPFDWSLMSRLVDNICEAARLANKEVFFLYANPASAEALRNDSRLRLEREFKFFGPGRNMNLYAISLPTGQQRI
jgi:SAM-dependent methyltransferase